MSVVIEALAGVEVVVCEGVPRALAPTESRHSTPLPDLARLALRQVKPQWKSSLNDRDLACLLQIIEVDLVPQLLGSYSPARCSPDDRFALG